MTYCVAIAIDKGLVFASDSRTNAGVDNVNTYPKMFRYQIPGKGFFVLMTSGNLATTQAVVHRVGRDLDADDAEVYSLADCDDLADAARYIGGVCVDLQKYHGRSQSEGQSNQFGATILVGGQVEGGDPGIYMVYPEGNYIKSSPYNPFLQIGETKYGKPILDRVIRNNMTLEEAARCALVSMDSTMRSNLSVAPPFDLLIYERDAFEPAQVMHLKLNSPYYARLRKQWGEGLLTLFNGLPPFDWEKD